MSDLTVYLNGRFIAAGEASVSIRDRGFLYGDGLFETMRAYAGRVFRLDDHLARLEASAEFLRISVPHSRLEFTDVISRLISTNALSDGRVRIALTRGAGGKGLLFTDDFEPTVLVEAGPLPSRPERLYAEGMALIVADLRQNARSPLPNHKTANFLRYLLARQQAADAGADDALILNTNDHVAEASVANVFLVRDRDVITPPLDAGVLPGITRKVVLQLCGTLGLPCAEAAFGLPELFAADEMFLTNSLMEVMPVREVEGKPIGRQCPGPTTRRLHAAYRERVAEELGLHEQG